MTVRSLADVRDEAAVEDAADVVVVGSGASGAVVAYLLCEAGLDVVVLEEGPYVRSEELRSDMYGSMRRMWRDGGFQVALGRAVTPILQGRCVGGTTVVNGAIIHRLPEPIHAAWQREHDLGSALPYAELMRASDRLDELLGVSPTPEPVQGNNARLLHRGLDELGLRGNAIRRSVIDCRGSAHCNQGCPTGQKQSMLATLIPRALERGARLYATCRAERVVGQSGRAVGVRARFVDPVTRERGPTLRVHARHAVVLAASAIQTPLLLSKSGFGRRSGLVGRRLQAHPGTALVGVFDQPVRMTVGATQGYESTHHWAERMKLETVSMPVELLAARLPGLGHALTRQLERHDHMAVWGVQVRAQAQGGVRAGLFGTDIRYQLAAEDVAVLKRGIFLLAELLFAAGAREVLPGVHGLPPSITHLDQLAPLADLPDDPRLVHCIAAHLFGTARLGSAESTSVVSRQLEVHDCSGLFVADSSVFPTNLGVNPQHSISAVAWLLGEQLAERVARGRARLARRAS